MKELLVAAELGNIERMNCIFKATEQWEMTHQWLTQGDIKGRTILHFAAIYGYMGVATCILDKITAITEDEILQKQYINIQDCKGRTPLFHAEFLHFFAERTPWLPSPISHRISACFNWTDTMAAQLLFYAEFLPFCEQCCAHRMKV